MTTGGYRKRRFLAPFSMIAFLFIGLVLFWVISSGEDKIKIYFYSSETNINNFKSLKMAFDRYLSRFGPYEFQPFKSRDVFEKQVKGKENCVFILSSWHYRHIHKEYSLIPVLSGVRKGKKYQRKILVADEKAPDIETSKPGLIASASSLQYTFSVLKKMLKKYAEHTFRVLTVPKDIDALLTVGVGATKLAFASRNAFDDLQGINPGLCRKMKVLAEGDKTLLLIVALPKGLTANKEKTVDMIKNMPLNPDGKMRIRMLGLDGWQELDALDRSKLES